MRWFAAVGGSVRWALRPDPLGCAFTDGGESTSLIVAGVTPEGGKSVRPWHAQRDARFRRTLRWEGSADTSHSERFLLPIAERRHRGRGGDEKVYQLPGIINMAYYVNSTSPSPTARRTHENAMAPTPGWSAVPPTETLLSSKPAALRTWRTCHGRSY